MKNLSKGKIAFVIVLILLLINSVTFFILKGNPYDTLFYLADMWTTFTGLSIGVGGLGIACAVAVYIVENWD